jgi:hypothetical protein
VDIGFYFFMNTAERYLREVSKSASSEAAFTLPPCQSRFIADKFECHSWTHSSSKLFSVLNTRFWSNIVDVDHTNLASRMSLKIYGQQRREFPGSTYVRPVLPGQTNTIVRLTLAGRFRVVACLDDGSAQRSGLLCFALLTYLLCRFGPSWL